MRLLQRTGILSEQVATPSYLPLTSVLPHYQFRPNFSSAAGLHFHRSKCQLCPASGVYSVDHNREAFLSFHVMRLIHSVESRARGDLCGVGKHARPAVHRQALTTTHCLKFEMPVPGGEFG